MNSRFNPKPLKSTIKEILIPTAAQATLFTSVAAFMLFIIFFDQIFKKLVGNDPTARLFFEQKLSDYLASLSSVPFAEYTSNLLFWGVVGTAVYLIILVVFNTFISVQNNLVIRQKENLPGAFDSFSLVDEYRRVVWILVFTIFLMLSISKFALIWFNAFRTGINDLNFLYMTFGLAVLSYNLYVLFMLAWTAVRNPNILARN